MDSQPRNPEHSLGCRHNLAVRLHTLVISTVDAQLMSAAEDDTLFLPLVLKPGVPAVPLVPNELFGVQMYGDTGASTLYFDSLKDSQAGWYRNDISWSSG